MISTQLSCSGFGRPTWAGVDGGLTGSKRTGSLLGDSEGVCLFFCMVVLCRRNGMTRRMSYVVAVLFLTD